MARPKLEEKTVTLEWVSTKNKKLKAGGEVYDITDKVASLDHAKFGCVGGATVTIKFNKDKVVSFMQKAKGEQKVEVPKEESKSSVASDSSVTEEVVTVHRIAATKKVLSFEEKNDGKKTVWYHPQEELVKAELNGVTAGQKVKVMLGTVVVEGKEQKNGVIDIHPVDTPAQTEDTTSTATSVTVSNDYDSNYKGSWAEKNDIERLKQGYINRQSAYKTACELCKGYVDQGESIEDVMKKVNQIAIAALKFIEN